MIAKVYPDSTNTMNETGEHVWSITAGTDHMAYAHDLAGKLTWSRDQNGTEHSYSYDFAGRQVADAITALGTGVDGAVRRIQRAYDSLGRRIGVAGYDQASGGNVLNEVRYEYGIRGQLTSAKQAHAGAVDAATPAVRYEYEDNGLNDAAEPRLSRIVYPNGRTVEHGYGTGIDDKVSRLAEISSGDSVCAQYDYLGMNTIVRLGIPAVSNELELARGADGSYPALDRFGRVLDQKWTVGGTVVDRHAYAYDAAGRRVAKVRPMTASLDMTESYGYDGLDQLIAMSRYPGDPGAPNQGVSWEDNFDSYATGSQMHGQGGWKGWDNNPAYGALTSAAQAHSGSNSVAIAGSSDLVHEYSGITSGQWAYTAWQYIPTSFSGRQYFIMQNRYNDGGPYGWSVQVMFDASKGHVKSDFDGAKLTLIKGQWVEIRVEIDLDADWQEALGSALKNKDCKR